MTYSTHSTPRNTLALNFDDNTNANGLQSANLATIIFPKNIESHKESVTRSTENPRVGGSNTSASIQGADSRFCQSYSTNRPSGHHLPSLTLS